jgi:hypothetical protein
MEPLLSAKGKTDPERIGFLKTAVLIVDRSRSIESCRDRKIDDFTCEREGV